MSSVFSRDLSEDFEFGRQNTPEYEFFNRCPRPEVENVRRLVEAWFDAMPDPEKPRLLRSLRSRDNMEHWSAFFELYCYQLLLRNDLDVIMHSPGGSNRAKDFRPKRKDVDIEVEAVVCTDSATQQTQEDILNTVLDYVDSNGWVAGFRYELEIEHKSDNLPPLNALAADIRRWASAYHRADLRAVLEKDGYNALPTRIFDKGDWTFRLTLVPRPSDEIDYAGFKKAIGVGPVEGGIIRNEKALWNTLKRKASHYQEYSFPFMIAVDSILEFPMQDEIDILQALFGTEQLAYNPITRKKRMARAPDGLWIGPKGPRNRHVSGVLVVNELKAPSVAKAKTRLYLHPWAYRPLQVGTISVPTSTWDKSTGQKIDLPGKQPWETFNLPQDWPY